MNPQRIIIPCPDMHHSEHNGYDYCHNPGAHGTSPYCRPDPRVSVFTCPRGYPGHHYDMEDQEQEDEIDIEVEISAGRQRTLEGFT